MNPIQCTATKLSFGADPPRLPTVDDSWFANTSVGRLSLDLATASFEFTTYYHPGEAAEIFRAKLSEWLETAREISPSPRPGRRKAARTAARGY